MSRSKIPCTPEQKRALGSFRAGNPPGHRTTEFDFVVVGAGSSGCIVANRLSQNHQVLLIEAGSETVQSPLVSSFLQCRALQKTEWDWQFNITPQEHLDSRRIAWPRGRGLGGSSILNYMVYNRGAAQIYDAWAEELASGSWSYEELLPLFKRSECNSEFGEPYHGLTGEMHVGPCPVKSPYRELFLEGATVLGFKADEMHDFNGLQQHDVAGFYQHTVRDGGRCSAADAFIRSSELKNLQISCSSLAYRINLEELQATSVEFVEADGTLVQARARKEIVVCAGAIDTPKLLMLSGIGPAESLQRFDIPVKVANEWVGKNLSDHPVVQLVHPAKAQVPAGDIPLGGLFLHSERNKQQTALPPADLQLHPYLFPSREAAMVCLGVTLVGPESRGRIELASSDVLDKPWIQPNYLSDPRDMEKLHSGVRVALELAGTEPFQRLIEGPVMQFESTTEDVAIQAGIRKTLSTIFHPMGTCRMGQENNSVVDRELQVHGVKGLRVADASVFPRPVNANTQAACMLVGEKAAALIH
ncbi:MAG: GMC family oxidoreductase N-terminal domain-containing protein [Planctomycetota bacterium]